MAKLVLCRCEDVTQKDVEHAYLAGYGDLEEVKRYTGFGTGPCQGKECMSLVARALCQLAAKHGQPVEATIKPFTARSPIVPTPLGILAAGSELGENLSATASAEQSSSGQSSSEQSSVAQPERQTKP